MKKTKGKVNRDRSTVRINLSVSSVKPGAISFTMKGIKISAIMSKIKRKISNEEKIKELSEYANRKESISVDLNDEKIVYGNNEVKFKVDSFKKKCLLEGLDDIALSLTKSQDIKDFENKMSESKPWI